MSKKFPIQQVLELAVAAFDLNQCKVERQAIKLPNVEIVPNRVYIELGLEGKMNLMVTEDQRQRAREIVSYLQQVKIMQTLRGERNQQHFLDIVLDLFTKPEIDRRDLGIVAWAPKLVQDFVRKDQEQQKIQELQGQSKYIGKIGSTVIIDFTLLNYKQIYNSNYAVTGHDAHGNLVCFWVTDKSKIYEQCQLRGRVKSQRESAHYHRARITQLNYVKILKETDEK